MNLILIQKTFASFFSGKDGDVQGATGATFRPKLNKTLSGRNLLSIIDEPKKEQEKGREKRERGQIRNSREVEKTDTE